MQGPKQQIFEMPRLQNLIDGNNWDPPNDEEGIVNKCADQAQINNVDVDQYCGMMVEFCSQFRLTINECYAYNFAEPEAIP